MRTWFAQFKAGNCDLVVQERLGRWFVTNEDLIKTVLENNPLCTIGKLAEIPNKSKSAIHNHTVKLGYKAGCTAEESNALCLMILDRNPLL